MKDLLPVIQSNDGRFHNGDPATGEQGTRVTDTWLNDVQERLRDIGSELIYLLSQANLTPVPTDTTQVYQAIVAVINANRRTASISQFGETKLTSDTGIGSADLAFSAAGAKNLAQQIAQNKLKFNDYIPNSKKSSAVNSNSADTVATSSAVKTAFDKAEEAKTIAEGKWSKQRASDTQEGTTVLSHVTNGTDRTKAASEFALGEVAKKSLPLGAVIGFPKEIANPAGFLLADGSTFNQAAFPDLYRMLGNSNRLPNLQRSDVGVTAWFAVDEIPAGWIPFDEIASRVGSRADQYPELHRHLSAKYGVMTNVPKVADRFIRNAGNGLRVGALQDDELKAHNHMLPSGEPRNNKHALAVFGWAENQPNVEVEDFYSSTVCNIRHLTSVTGGAETRPKSLVLKLCIKAQNSFDDVKFWVKAFGAVDNEGLLVASQLAQGLQGKAERNHTHSVAQITDFNQKADERINTAFNYQKVGNFEIHRFPNGTMIISGFHLETTERGGREVLITLPQAFINAHYICAIAEGGSDSMNDKFNWSYAYPSTNAKLAIKTWYSNTKVQFIAIGRWK